jgi:hypothetical protein
MDRREEEEQVENGSSDHECVRQKTGVIKALKLRERKRESR